MSVIDLTSFSLSELKKLRKEVDAEIEGFAEKKRKEALAVLEEKAKEMGFTSLSAVTGKAVPKPALAPKYRDPKNPENTWTGRGRKPKWFTALVDAGVSIEELEI